MGFDPSIHVQFHGAKVTIDAGLLLACELDEALGLTRSAEAKLNEKRTGRNVQHGLPSLLMQSVYSSLAGYEDTNDHARFSRDPAMRAAVGKLEEGKNTINWTKLSCSEFRSNEVRLQLSVLAYDPGNFLRRLVLPKAISHWSLASVQLKMVKMGAKMVSHARRFFFQAAEVALPRDLFAKTLSRIRGLCPQPG